MVCCRRQVVGLILMCATSVAPARPAAASVRYPVAGHEDSLLPSGRVFRLAWSDEFDGCALDKDKWAYRLNMMGRRHPAWTDRGVTLDGKGNCVFTLVEEDGRPVSSQLQTGFNFMDEPLKETKFGADHLQWNIGKLHANKFTRAFGYWECRCRLQRKPGWWSAFWLQSPIIGSTLDSEVSGTEIDVMESFKPGVVSAHGLHWAGYGQDHKDAYVGGSGRERIPEADGDGWHRFGVLWDETGYVFYVDGREDGRIIGRGVSLRPEFVLISTEVDGYRRKDHQPTPEARAAIGDTFVVDYVRVFDILPGEPENAFRGRMAELHHNRLAEDAAPVATDETVIDASWRIVCEADDDVVRHAAADLADYFAKSMGVEVREEGRGKRKEGGEAKKRIVLAVDPALEKLQSKVEVTADGVRVTGVTPREVFQGCCRLEDMLSARGRPALKRETRTFTRMFSPRMTHSGWEVEKFPDVYMDQLAHQGMDAILVFIADPPDVSRNGKEDMNELVERARVRGLDVYAYCWFPVKAAKFNPNDSEAEAWYEETYGAIVRNAPGIKGLVCVGESVGFPTKDGTTAGYWWGRREERVPGKTLNGFYPTLEWVPWLEKVARATRKFRPDLDLVFWTYNWYSRPAEIRLPLLEKIPTNVTMLVTFAMGDVPEKKCGVDTWMWDYSITRPGPGTVFRSEAEIAKRRGIRLYSMANCGGRTWDLGCAPYHPVPERWIERFRNVRSAQDDYGLSGLMECHHYGFQPNFISEIAKTAFTRETDARALDEELRALAARDFGRANVETVLAAWHDWSEAFRWHSAHHCDLAGPYRTGPVYPFVLPGEQRPLPLEPQYEYYEGERYGDGWKYLEREYSMPAELLPPYLEMSRREVAAFERGCAKLRAVLEQVPEEKRVAARRLLANGEFHLATARTMLNAREFRLAGFEYGAKETAPEAREAARQKLLAILAAERQNVQETVPLVSLDSALGWEPTMFYVCGPRQLEWKLGQLADVESKLRGAR